jgi:perosamine synthetase
MSQLKKLPKWIERRREIAHRYDEAFSILPRIKPLSVRSIAFHAYHLYVVRLNLEGTNLNRGMLFKQLRENGIGVNVHYIPVHLHPFYRKNFKTMPGLCPVSEKAYNEIISLPIFPNLHDKDLRKVTDTFKRLFSEL